jgi:hypothetical protein
MRVVLSATFLLSEQGYWGGLRLSLFFYPILLRMICNSNKVCSSCKKELGSDCFYKHGKYLTSKCRDCTREYRKANYNSEVENARQRKKNYGISQEQYDEMLKRQGNGCKFCGKTPEENKQRLAVDHCHDTGKVRGLLCSTCNLGLGYFMDDISLLTKAILHIKEHVPNNL